MLMMWGIDNGKHAWERIEKNYKYHQFYCRKEIIMSKKEVERFLIAGGENKDLRLKYNLIETMPKFVVAAVEDGFDFNEDELKAVLRESGDSFDSYGNPRKRDIWWF